MLIEGRVSAVKDFASVINQPISATINTKNGICRFYPLSSL
jgi:hypothetical protein